MSDDKKVSSKSKAADPYQKVRVMNPTLPVELVSANINITGMPALEVKVARQQWEYAFAQINDHMSVTFDGLGVQGYEFVSITPKGLMIFKRPK